MRKCSSIKLLNIGQQMHEYLRTGIQMQNSNLLVLCKKDEAQLVSCQEILFQIYNTKQISWHGCDKLVWSF